MKENTPLVEDGEDVGAEFHPLFSPPRERLAKMVSLPPTIHAAYCLT